MKLFKLSVCCVCLLVFLKIKSEGKEWNGIKPLHSMREDVQKIQQLNPSGDSYDVFDLATERVMIFYANKPCKNTYDKWDVPVGTVLEIVVMPKKTTPLSELDIDLSLFKKSSHISDIGTVNTYNDEENGLAVEVRENKVIGIYYRPTKRDSRLLCPTRKNVKQFSN